jgi:hypothetical protein
MIKISFLRLKNRAFIKEDHIQQVLDIANKYNLGIIVGNTSPYMLGPFIDQIFKTDEALYPNEQFQNFITDLIPHLDLYHSLFVNTFLEFDIKYFYYLNDKDISTLLNNEIIVYYVPQIESFKISAIKNEDGKIKKLSIDQIRIDISNAIQDNSSFILSS